MSGGWLAPSLKSVAIVRIANRRPLRQKFHTATRPKIRLLGDSQFVEEICDVSHRIALRNNPYQISDEDGPFFLRGLTKGLLNSAAKKFS